MLFISKMIFDPNERFANKMGRTVGLVFYTPKFIDCQKYDFYTSQWDDSFMESNNGQLPEDIMERRYLTKFAHRNCKRRHKHMTYPGYMFWVTPKGNRLTFRYMGATWSTERWWRPFSWSKDRASYVRWFDNGPKNKAVTMSDFSAKHIEIMVKHRDEFRAAMARSRQQMNEYARIRSSDGGRKKWNSTSI